jgi:hypothetical protein
MLLVIFFPLRRKYATTRVLNKDAKLERLNREMRVELFDNPLPCFDDVWILVGNLFQE